MTRGTAAIAIAVADTVGYVALSLWDLAANEGRLLSDPLSAALMLAAIVAFAATGALLVTRAPDNAVGGLLVVTATLLVGGIFVQGFGLAGTAASPNWPGAAIVAALTDVWFTSPYVLALVGVPLLFPDGRLPSRRFWWVVGATIAGTVCQALAGLAPLALGPADIPAAVDALTAVSWAATLAGIIGAGVATSVRFRSGNSVQRQQLKLLLAVALVAVVAFPTAELLGSSNTLLALVFWAIAFVAFLCLPLSIAVAILRYRLYDIDRVISRTIAYAVVTVTLASIFVGAVLVFQVILAPLTGGNTEAVAASTLVVAALFQPLQRRVQVVVDRRFNRARYDAERAVAAFAAQLRDEVDLESVRADVLAVVAQTVAPASLALWIRRAEPEG